MMYAINGVMLALGSSLATSIIAKATLITAAGLIAAWLARRSRAAVRHALLAASLAALLALPIAAFLVPPVRIAVAQQTTLPSREAEATDRTQPYELADVNNGITSSRARRSLPPLYDLLLAGWLAGTLFFLLRMITGLRQVHFLRQFGLPWCLGQVVVERMALDTGISRYVEVLLHESLPAPVTCGVVRPAILLPLDAQAWDSDDLNRAIMHELEHVRRGDWLSHCLARAVCAAYWFHPLVWIAWRQLALEAERSCDDAVLRRSEATAYADQLVKLAQRLSTVRKTPALAMASRSDLSSRVRAVLDSRQQRGRAGTILVALACLAAVVAVVAMSPLRMVAAPQQPTLVPGPWLQADTTRPASEAASVKPAEGGAEPVQLVQSEKNPTMADVGPPAQSDAGRDNKLTFEVVSIKLAPPDDGRNVRRVNGDSSQQSYENTTLYGLVAEAYSPPEFYKVVGQVPTDGPASQHYNVIVKIPSGTTKSQYKIMLRNMLAERFGLMAHQEAREFTGYDLVVAKGGPKLKDAAEFTRPQTPPDPSKTELDQEGYPKLNYPTMFFSRASGPNGAPATRLSARAQPVSMLLPVLQNATGGPIDDKTGLTGKYDFNLEYSFGVVATSADTSTSSPQAADPGPADIRSAIKNLGLVLEPMRVTLDVLVVDHVEKNPTEN